MATFTNPDTVHRASPGAVAPAAWGDTVNDDLNFLYGDTGWTTVSSFTNGWSAGQAVRYMLLGRIVYLDGYMNAGTAGATAFTLPVGYRPSVEKIIAVPNGTGTIAVVVNSDGTVQPQVSAATWLSGISFPIV